MANTELIAGVDSFLTLGVESPFGSAAAGTFHLGLVTSFTPTINRNATEQRGFVGSASGGQLPSSTLSGVVESGFTVDFTPLEWSWIEYVMGSVSVADGTAGTPFVYSFAANPSGITFVHSINNDTTDREEKYVGCRFATTTFRAALGEPVTVSMDVQALNFSKDASLQGNVGLPSGITYNFSGADIELPDGSSISNIIDSIEFTITRAVNRRAGMGGFEPKASRYGQTELRLNFTILYLNETFLDLVMGSSTTVTGMTNSATLTLKFSSTNANKFAEFKLTNVTFPDYTEGANLNDFLTEGLTGFARGLTVEETTAA